MVKESPENFSGLFEYKYCYNSINYIQHFIKNMLNIKLEIYGLTEYN